MNDIRGIAVIVATCLLLCAAAGSAAPRSPFRGAFARRADGLDAMEDVVADAGEAACRVCKNGRRGLADKDCRLILPPGYSCVVPAPRDGFTHLARGGKWRIDAGEYPLFRGAGRGVADAGGEIPAPPACDAIAPSGDGWQFLARSREDLPVP